MAAEIKYANAAKSFYRSFSTKDFHVNGKSFSQHNLETVKTDLNTEIMTEIGTRLRMPNYGTRIPSLTFEPNDAETRNIVKEDITRVVKNDPRVEMLDIQVVSLEDNSAIVAFVDVLYIELNIKDTLQFNAVVY